MGKVLYLIPDDVPNDTVQCLAELLRQAKKGVVTGLAFVAYLDGRGYIVNSAGQAHEDPTRTRGMLRALDDKLAVRINGGNP